MGVLRHFSRFSLRTFFTALMGLSVVVGWGSLQFGASQREAAAIAKLSEIVGPVEEVRGLLFVAT